MHYELTENEFYRIESCMRQMDLITDLCSYVPQGYHALNTDGLQSFLCAQQEVLHATLKALAERQEAQRKANQNAAEVAASKPTVLPISADLLVRVMQVCKRFKGVSAKWFMPDDPRNPAPGVWYLRHIGFLDGCNPAVKGLEPVAFAESWWDGSMVTSMFELEVAFSEAPQGDLGPDGERQILHEIAQILMKRKPGMDYKTAAFAAHSEIEKYKDRRTQAVQQDPDRVAFHEAALNYQATIPGTTYQQAAQHILSLS